MTQTCELPEVRRSDGTKRGERWLVLSFLFCPCHLPLTLGALALLGGGTAIGAFVRGNGLAVGVVVSLLWAAGTWRGFWLIRRAERAARTAMALDDEASLPRR